MNVLVIGSGGLGSPTLMALAVSGIGTIGVVDFDKHQVTDYFPELFALKSSCKFNNCLHLNEPKCAVKKALADGVLSATRYESYVQLLSDDDEHYRQDVFKS